MSAGWRRSALCVVALLGAGLGQALAAAGSERAIDEAFEHTLRHYHLPGLALGVIRDGKVVYRRTAGERVSGSGQPVTPDSLFKIASNGKAMTTAVLARLVDAGKLRWDDPVRRHLPQFRMHDAWVTEHMQVRDLLIHNSGLGEGAGDLMLWPEPNAFTRADVIAGLAHLVPTHSFRSRYAYDNVLYIVAGELAAAVAGISYEQLVQREVFTPLGMERCRVGDFDRDAVGNIAQPHMRVDQRNVPIRLDPPQVPTTTSAAAGGIRCSLDDMLVWMQAWLSPDSAPGWLSAQQREALWTAQMPLPISERQRRWSNTHLHAYGYGWRLADMHGAFTVGHTGTLAGMYSALLLVPDRRSGFIMLTNGNGGVARIVLGQVLAEMLVAPATARSVEHYAGELDRKTAADTGSVAAPPPRQPVPPAEMAGVLGIYQDPWFGEVALCADGGRVRFAARKSPALTGTVMRAGSGLLVDWDLASVDAEPWLHFPSGSDDAGADDTADEYRGAHRTSAPLRLSHVDPDADFSYDYADLAFVRTTSTCP